MDSAQRREGRRTHDLGELKEGSEGQQRFAELAARLKYVLDHFRRTADARGEEVCQPANGPVILRAP